MAIVPNKDGQGIIANGFSGNVDVSYTVPTASGAGIPNGTFTSLYTDQLYYDSTNNRLYKSLKGGTNNQWVATSELC